MSKIKTLFIILLVLICAAALHARTISTADDLAALSGTEVSEDITLAPGTYDLTKTGFGGFRLYEAVFDGGGATVLISVKQLKAEEFLVGGPEDSYDANAGFVTSSILGTIKNLTIKLKEGGTLTPSLKTRKLYVGAVCGYAGDSTIENVTVLAADGITMSADKSENIYFGGICGCNWYGNINECSAENCRFNVPGGSESIRSGCICGESSGSISGCRVDYCNISAADECGMVICGGVCGNNDCGQINGCSVTGSTVSSRSDSDYCSNCGGIAGGSEGLISGCYAVDSSVTANGSDSYSCAGGVCAYNGITDFDPTISECWIDGCTLKGVYTGGVFAWIEETVTVKNCAVYCGNKMDDVLGDTEEYTNYISCYFVSGDTVYYYDKSGNAKKSCSYSTSCGKGWAAANLGDGWSNTYTGGQPWYKDFLSDAEAPEVGVTGIELNRTKILYLKEGKTYTFVPTIHPDNAADKRVKWGMGNSALCSLYKTSDTRAIVYGKSQGRTQIGVRSLADESLLAKCGIQVYKPITKAEISAATLTLSVGQTKTLKAKITPSDATYADKIKWGSTKSKIASVDANGKITARSKGTCIVGFRTSEGGFKATCKVTVK